ncbi:hypothetical protein QAD02_005108 [Eretmocerus hayati]|uniref:Uncharacterized protein n=1 Tax=Eretmocerus hayati TaxID=131215 RepID=A0ACC2NSI6_9HYME|nr:hypothetical protein QAD02_005108 [Eretmocerus hayati]
MEWELSNYIENNSLKCYRRPVAGLYPFPKPNPTLCYHPVDSFSLMVLQDKGEQGNMDFTNFELWAGKLGDVCISSALLRFGYGSNKKSSPEKDSELSKATFTVFEMFIVFQKILAR